MEHLKFGDLDANQWTETSVDISISAFPSLTTTMTLQLSWLDMYDNLYERNTNAPRLLKILS